MSTTQALKVFEDKRIRTFWDDQDEKWLFCINDIIEALTESSDPAVFVYSATLGVGLPPAPAQPAVELTY